MFSDKITLDRKTFKVLAADTRIEILKRLAEHKETLTDISEGLKLSPSTVKEHLEKLVEAELIEQIESDTKWKYYRLTRKGERILKPHEANIILLLSASILFLIGSLYNLTSKLTSKLPAAESRMIAEAPVKMADQAVETVATQTPSLPTLEILLVVVFALATGALVVKSMRK